MYHMAFVISDGVLWWSESSTLNDFMQPPVSEIFTIKFIIVATVSVNEVIVITSENIDALWQQVIC